MLHDERHESTSNRGYDLKFTFRLYYTVKSVGERRETATDYGQNLGNRILKVRSGKISTSKARSKISMRAHREIFNPRNTYVASIVEEVRSNKGEAGLCSTPENGIG